LEFSYNVPVMEAPNVAIWCLNAGYTVYQRAQLPSDIRPVK
jgi:hypothetical protein